MPQDPTPAPGDLGAATRLLPASVSLPGPRIAGCLIPRRAAVINRGCLSLKRPVGQVTGRGEDSFSSVPHPTQTRGRRGRCLLPPPQGLTCPLPCPCMGPPGGGGHTSSFALHRFLPAPVTAAKPLPPRGNGGTERGGQTLHGGGGRAAPRLHSLSRPHRPPPRVAVTARHRTVL